MRFHFTNKIREAIDVYFKAKSVFKLGARTLRAGEPVLIFDTVKTSTFEVAAEMSYVTGGRGNSRILSYEGDKTLTFNFEDALLSAEGLAILSGADLIPARNKQLPGSSPEARSVVSHFTEKYSVATNNRIDIDTNNVYPDDTSLGSTGDLSPMGGILNVWLTRKPYVGQNSSIYVMLLDKAGEMSGAPIEINLKNTETDFPTGYPAAQSYLAKFDRTNNNRFIAFDRNGAPMATKIVPNKPNIEVYPKPTTGQEQAVFDDLVMHYVDVGSATKYWVDAWGTLADIDTCYVRLIGEDATNPGNVDPNLTVGGWDFTQDGVYGYLVAPSGGVGQPKAFKEGTSIVYKINVPSILYQDIVLLDYYVEYQHDATQVSILPDKFAPYMYVEGSSLIRRASDGMDLPVEFVIPKFKVTTALTFTLASTGDPSTFTFQGDAYPDFSKFDLTRRVLADIQILDADDNYDGASGDAVQSDPTSYRRFRYNEDQEGEYLWKDPSMEPHSNLDYSDTGDYVPTHGGPATKTPGLGLTDTAPSDGATPIYP
jgi:hypothetical protein